MTTGLAGLNLVVAWVLVVLGMLSGAGLGLGFERDEWLGGYSGLRRRLYRLGHISFFGLAGLNALFFGTVRGLGDGLDGMGGAAWQWASWLWVVGGGTMPMACLLTAHWPRLKPVFAIPVLSLLGAGGVTLWGVTWSVMR